MLYEYLPKGEAAELYVTNRDLLNFQNEIADTYDTKQHVSQIEQSLRDAIDAIDTTGTTPGNTNPTVAGLDKLEGIVGEPLEDYYMGLRFVGNRRSLVNLSAKVDDLEENKVDTISINGGEKLHRDLSGNIDIVIEFPESDLKLGYESTNTKYAVQADLNSKLYVDLGTLTNSINTDIHDLELSVDPLTTALRNIEYAIGGNSANTLYYGNAVNNGTQDSILTRLDDTASWKDLAKIVNGREVKEDIDSYIVNIAAGHQLTLNQIEQIVYDIKDQTSWDAKVDDSMNRMVEDTTSSLGEYLDRYMQAKLYSGSNIKTINGHSVLGSGNIQIDGVTIDSALSDSSTNPVQNRAVTQELGDHFALIGDNRNYIQKIEYALGGDMSVEGDDSNIFVYGYNVQNHISGYSSILDRLNALSSSLNSHAIDIEANSRAITALQQNNPSPSSNKVDIDDLAYHIALFMRKHIDLFNRFK